MGRIPNNRRKHWVVFGAQEGGDKSLLAYKDAKTDMYAIKVLQNADNAGYDIGDEASTDFAAVDGETTGEYTTIYFAKKNGIKSLDVFIKQLQQLKRWMDAEDVESSPSYILLPISNRSSFRYFI